MEAITIVGALSAFAFCAPETIGVAEAPVANAPVAEAPKVLVKAKTPKPTKAQAAERGERPDSTAKRWKSFAIGLADLLRLSIAQKVPREHRVLD